LENLKKTKEMEQYEKETGKYAIWRGKVTDSFKKWKKGEKIYDINKERITFYVSEEIKGQWQEFAKKFKYPTISKLVREGVSNFIETKSTLFRKNLKNINIDAISTLSHSLKEPLTSIKGYLQLLIEAYKETLNEDIIEIIDKVLDQCKLLENKIMENLDNIKVQSEHYDILLIEDNISTVNLLQNYFKAKGYSCKAVLTGSKGLEELDSCTPKLILLDIILPDLNGFDICKAIKSDDNMNEIPIYYLTAIPGHKVEKRMEETKANGIILKPFNLKDLNFLFEFL
jgi:CheY-like chemotaxis protein